LPHAYTTDTVVSTNIAINTETAIAATSPSLSPDSDFESSNTDAVVDADTDADVDAVDASRVDASRVDASRVVASRVDASRVVASYGDPDDGGLRDRPATAVAKNAKTNVVFIRKNVSSFFLEDSQLPSNCHFVPDVLN
jgi:hypothetical protein